MSKLLRVKETVFYKGLAAPVYILRDNSYRIPVNINGEITYQTKEWILSQKFDDEENFVELIKELDRYTIGDIL